MKILKRLRGKIGKTRPLAKLVAGSYTTKTQEVAREVIRRPALGELVQVAAADPIVFTSINLYANIIASLSYRVESEDERTRRVVSEFLEESEFKRKIREIAFHLCLFGNSFVEKCFNQYEKLVDFKVVSAPQTIEPKREAGEVKLDEKTGRPVQFVQRVRGRKIEIAENKLAHFILREIPGSWKGMGLVEPLYKTIQRKLNIEEALGQVAFRTTCNFGVFTTGSLEHERFCTEDEFKGLERMLKNLEQRDYLILPPWVKANFIKPGSLGEFVEAIQVENDVIFASMGIPPTVMGLSLRGAGRAVETQHLMFERKVKMILDAIVEQFRGQILKQLCEERDLRGVPEIEFEKVQKTDLLSRARRLGVYARSGLIKRDDRVEERIREMEDLPTPITPPSEKSSKEEEIRLELLESMMYFISNYPSIRKKALLKG